MFLIVFGAHVNILFISEAEFLCSLSGRIGPFDCVDY